MNVGVKLTLNYGKTTVIRKKVNPNSAITNSTSITKYQKIFRFNFTVLSSVLPNISLNFNLINTIITQFEWSNIITINNTSLLSKL